MIRPYLDTGIVLKLIVLEPLSARVQVWLQKHRVAVPYPRLVEVELENTLQAKLFRKEITPSQVKSCHALVHELLMQGRFFRPPLSLDDVLIEALELMPRITASTGCRTLDLLHITSARKLDCSEFVTSDRRQAKAARLLELKVTELKEN
jgi:predicted nucleic acid-binding protein